MDGSGPAESSETTQFITMYNQTQVTRISGVQEKYSSENRLQHRLAEFLSSFPSARAVNGGEDICVGTHVGAIRKKNEDRALIIWATYSDVPKRNFLLGVVSDGIGGLARGDEAAVLAVGVFSAQIVKYLRLPIASRMRAAAEDANNAVYSLLQGKGGATLSAALIADEQLVGVNVGDSRIYGISGDRKITQLTQDDTLAGYLGRREKLDPKENGLVQFIGMGKGLEPHIITARREALSSILVTSDGVHGAPKDALSEVVRFSRTNIEIINRLITLSTILGGRDNSTALAFPTIFQDPPVAQGTNITCITPFDRLEIWAPLTEATTSEHLQTPDEKKAEVSTVRANPKTQRNATNQRDRKKKGKKKRGSNGDIGLPLDDNTPSLDISFPEKQKT